MRARRPRNQSSSGVRVSCTRAPLASVHVLGRRGAIALTCAAVLAMPAAAHANAFDDALKEYRTTGAVDGCKHTAAELAQAKAQMPEDIAQTAPGFPAQLAVAAAQRTKGCGKDAAKTTSTATAATPPATAPGATQPPAATPTTAPGATQPPAAAPTTAPGATQPPAGAPTTAAAPGTAAKSASAADDGVPVVLVLAGALVVLVLVLWGLARWWAWEPCWLVGWRHATAEAGWRASAAWAEFTDWLRLGR
jgi:hypothetical protein